MRTKLLRQSDEAAYYEGEEAFENGQDIADCPYTHVQTQWKAWREGWIDAESRKANANGTFSHPDFTAP